MMIRNPYCCLGGCLAGLIAVLAAYWNSQYPYEPSERSVTNTTVMAWRDDLKMTELLVSVGKPTVLQGTPFNDFDASQLELLLLNTDNHHHHHESPLVPCKTSSNPVFQYHAVDQPLEQFTNRSRSYQENIMRAETVMKNIFTHLPDSSTASSIYHYSTASIETLNITLERSILDKLIFPPYNQPLPPQVNYWMGGAGVTAYIHYDTSYNLHYLIKGMKRFILAPPTLHSRLKLYSCLHQLYRQAQVDPTLNSSAHSVNQSYKSDFIIIDLFPSQAIYLPPYWFHTVITMEPSLSLNIWTDSHDYLLMEQVLKSPIPFESTWPLHALLNAAKIFIDLLLHEVIEDPSPAVFIINAVLPRYDSIIDHITSEIQSESPLPSGCGQTLDDVTQLDKIRLQAETTSELFAKMSEHSIREINMGNYIEHILYTLLREYSPLYVPLCLSQCWGESL